MFKYIAVLMMLCLAGCASRTEFGSCVGVVDQKDPTLKYEYSGTNIILGFIFSETLIVPGMVLLKQLECPVGKK